MITNDYYDARNGVDTVEPITNIHDSDTDSNNYEHYHPLAAGLLPFTITKTFDSYLYAILLLSSAFVPGVVSRLLVIGGAIITYLYTVQ
jgi:4-hydroxybenzoate polyprenyltransferase